MLERKEHLEITVLSRYGEIVLYIYPQNSKAELYEENAPYIGEPCHHLLEGCTYNYEFASIGDKQFQFASVKNLEDIVTRHKSPRHPSEGTLHTGNYVGTLQMPIVCLSNDEEVGKVGLEIRSTKAGYESDYRRMLDEIAEYYTDLILQQGSPVTQQLEIDDSCPSTTLYQRFSFIRSIIDSEAFSEAIHKIIISPVRKWAETTIERNIVGVRRLSRNNMRQLASSHDRVTLPMSNRKGMPDCLTSVPRSIDVNYKRDTIDNQENQFVKFVLRSFCNFCIELANKPNATDRLKDEVKRTVEQLSTHLENQFFRKVSMPTHINFNSPVLQRKEGYREVLQAWLIFDLAAKLNWSGGDNVYEAGKKNVATLYEYWLFFKLLELISEFFELNSADKKKLVKMDADGINLDIIQGRQKMISGRHITHTRVLNVAFYYNRTFCRVSQDQDPIHKAGSWTMAMRPDYTLSLWPGEISESEAEKQELIVHIHFDAKYRLNKVLLEDKENISEDEINEQLLEEKSQQELGVYKRADLLKMHAYKDAIRRTSGAYVLYPGDERREIKGFHEIIPGLGAFSVRPGNWQADSIYLKQFLAEVKAHLLDRASDREKLSYYQYDIHKQQNQQMVMESLPEPVGQNRDFLPDETSVVVAYYRDQEHLDWILQRHMYNMRAGSDKGSMQLEPNLINARYILLHDDKQCQPLIRLVKGGPKVYTRAQLIKMGYPQYRTPSGEIDVAKEAAEADRIYLVFELFKNNQAEKEMRQYDWDVKDLFRTRTYPIRLVNLLKNRPIDKIRL